MKTFEKKEQNQMIFGIHPVLEACKANKEIDKIFVQSSLRSAQINEICMHARNTGIPIQHVPVEKLNRLTRKNHQGVVAFISPISYQLIEQLIPMIYEEGRVPFIVVLDRITDVRNFGAIARSAYAAGVDALVIPSKGSALINPDAMKASSGALSMINVCRVDYIKNALDFLKESGLKIVGISEKGDKNIWDSELNVPLALIMGSEEDGISESYLKKVDEHLIIPMPGDIDSLNVSVATGIVCFEVVHQRLNK